MKRVFLFAHFISLILFLSLAIRISAEPDPSGPQKAEPAASANDADRIRKLEQQVVELQAQVRELIKRQGPELSAQPRLPEALAASTKPATASERTLSQAEKAALEAEFAESMGGVQPGAKPASAETTPARTWSPPPPLAVPAAGRTGTGRLRLIDLSVSLLNDYSLSTARESKFKSLMGGDHDPKNKGFSAPNEEFVMGGVVDEHFRGDLDLVPKLSGTGETEIEIEEAYLSTHGLGRGLQLKAGTWFQDFGRLNNSHPHAWEFANQPVAYTRFMSKDNMKSPGTQLSWLIPSKEYYKLYLAAQSPLGDSMYSFRSGGGNDLSGTDEEHQVGGHAFSDLEVRGIRDLAYTTRLETSRMLSDEATVLGGLSFITGPNSTGRYARTNIYGLDLYYKWKPLNNDHGWPFWTWQTEILKRDYAAYSTPLFSDPTVILPKERLNDWGFYTQVIHGFKRQWSMGLRFDYADASGDAAGIKSLDPLRDRRWRISPNITHFFSEFSKLRYQYDYDVAKHLGDKPEHAFTIQYEVNFGAHGAHKF